MAKKSDSAVKIDISKHELIPIHIILSDDETQELFKKYNISFKDLPRISVEDPAIQHLNPKVGDVVKIERKSITAGISYYYRGVINA